MSERDENIDALRGISFVAVILLNLLSEFRVPFLLRIEKFHTEPGFLNHAVDWVTAFVLEAKGFTILSMLFGAGIAMMRERHGNGAYSILLRRYLFLLLLGLAHMFLVFSGDILTLYALCGLIIIPLIFMDSLSLITFTIAFMCIRFFVSWPPIPTGVSSQQLIESSLRSYGAGGFFDMIAFRWFEFKHLILPLLLSVWPRTLAVMLFGFLAWKHRWFTRVREPRFGWNTAIVSLTIGAASTAGEAFAVTHGLDLGHFGTVIGDTGIVALTIGYATLVLRLDSSNRVIRWTAPFGRMSLTGYLSQTLVLGILFYGYGFGLYGKLGSFSAFCLGLFIYGLQIVAAQFYFSKFKQGPVEAIWRKFTYGWG